MIYYSWQRDATKGARSITIPAVAAAVIWLWYLINIRNSRVKEKRKRRRRRREENKSSFEVAYLLNKKKRGIEENGNK